MNQFPDAADPHELVLSRQAPGENEGGNHPRSVLFTTLHLEGLMARSRYRTLPDHRTYFVTCTVVNWLPLFAFFEVADIVLEAMRFRQNRNLIRIHAYVLMLDHLHLIGSSPDFRQQIGRFKSFTARRIVAFLLEYGHQAYLEQLETLKKPYKTDQKYQVWQEGSHPQAIISDEMLMQKANYIHYNPVRRGYVDEPGSWTYSSYSDYLGHRGLVPIEPVV